MMLSATGIIYSMNLSKKPYSNSLNLNEFFEKEKSKFKEWLTLRENAPRVVCRVCYTDSHTAYYKQVNFDIGALQQNPTSFLQYIYTMGDEDFTPIDDRIRASRWQETSFTHLWFGHPYQNDESSTYYDWIEPLKKACIDAKINGYSALGIAVIAGIINREKKEKLIRDLLECGFVPTEKDKELAWFEYYEHSQKAKPGTTPKPLL